jgi:hypothetical protein
MNKYIRIFNITDPLNGRFTKFIIIDQYVGFSGEGRKFGFIDSDMHTDNTEPTLYRVNVSLQ